MLYYSRHLLIALFQVLFSTMYAQTALDSLKITSINNHLFIHTSFLRSNTWTVGCNGLIYINKGQAVILDTPVSDSASERLLHWLDEQAVEVVAVAPTHWHVDCLGGLQAFHERGIPSYALDNTCKLAADHGVVVPRHAFVDSVQLWAGDEQVLVRFHGGGHTVDNTVAWIPSEQALFAGCMLKGLEYNHPGNLADADLEAWPITLQTLIKKYGDARFVVPGHGTFGGVELLSHMEQLLEPHLKPKKCAM